MRHFLCAFLWAVLALLAIDKAQAAAPTTWYGSYPPQFGNSIVYWGATKTNSCAQVATRMKGQPWNTTGSYTGNVSAIQSSEGTYCYAETVNSSGTISYNAQSSYSTKLACYDGSAAVGGVCPEPPPVCTPGAVLESTVYQGTKDPVTGLLSGGAQAYAYPTIIGGCLVRVTDFLQCLSTSDGKVYCKYRYVQSTVAPTGSSSTPTTTVPAGTTTPTVSPTFNPATGQGCPAGTVAIGTDPSGLTQCAGTGTSAAVPTTTGSTKTTTVTNADGTTTTTATTTHTNADGSVTTTSKVTNTATDGTATTTSNTSTGNTSGGLTGKPDPIQSDQDKSDLCKMHPELNVCKNSTVDGACETITCTGDAIQCSILKATAEQNCRAKKDITDLTAAAHTTLGNQLLAGTDPLASTLPTKANAGSYTTPSSLDNSGWMGGGACFPDKTFTIQGKTITLSFAKACDPLLTFRYALMIISLLVSFRMLSGVILKD